MGAEIYATPGQRLAAWLVDAVVVNAVTVPILLVATPLEWGQSGLTPSEIVGVVSLGIAAALAYFVICDASVRGATIGKRVVGIRVVDSEGRVGALGYPRAVVRRLAYLAGGLALWAGPLWALIDPRRQALHDKAARTIVIRTASRVAQT